MPPDSSRPAHRRTTNRRFDAEGGREMAGDLPFEELLVVYQEPGAAATAARDASAPIPVAPPTDVPAGRVLQRYGDRVEIRIGAKSRDPDAARAPKVSAKVLAS